METGRVVALQGNHAEVVVERSEMCNKCGACTVLSSGQMQASALNEVGARIGERVAIELGEGSVLKAAALVYVVPLIAFIAAYLLGAALAGALGASADAVGIPAGIAGLIVAFLVLSRYDRSLRERGQYELRIVEVERGNQDAS